MYWGHPFDVHLWQRCLDWLMCRHPCAFNGRIFFYELTLHATKLLWWVSLGGKLQLFFSSVVTMPWLSLKRASVEVAMKILVPTNFDHESVSMLASADTPQNSVCGCTGLAVSFFWHPDLSPHHSWLTHKQLASITTVTQCQYKMFFTSQAKHCYSYSYNSTAQETLQQATTWDKIPELIFYVVPDQDSTAKAVHRNFQLGHVSLLLVLHCFWLQGGQG